MMRRALPLCRSHVCAKSLQSCLTLCDSMDCSPPGSSVHGILQARLLEWVAMPSSRDLPDPGIESVPLLSPALASGFFTTSATWEAPLINKQYSLQTVRPERYIEIVMERMIYI